MGTQLVRATYKYAYLCQRRSRYVNYVCESVNVYINLYVMICIYAFMTILIITLRVFFFLLLLSWLLMKSKFLMKGYKICAEAQTTTCVCFNVYAYIILLHTYSVCFFSKCPTTSLLIFNFFKCLILKFNNKIVKYLPFYLYI